MPPSSGSPAQGPLIRRALSCGTYRHCATLVPLLLHQEAHFAARPSLSIWGRAREGPVPLRGLRGGYMHARHPTPPGARWMHRRQWDLKRTHTHTETETHARSVCSDEGPGRDRQTTLQRKKKGHIEIAKRAASSVSAMYYVSCIRNEADGFIVTLSPSHR